MCVCGLWYINQTPVNGTTAMGNWNAQTELKAEEGWSVEVDPGGVQMRVWSKLGRE